MRRPSGHDLGDHGDHGVPRNRITCPGPGSGPSSGSGSGSGSGNHGAAQPRRVPRAPVRVLPQLWGAGEDDDNNEMIPPWPQGVTIRWRDTVGYLDIVTRIAESRHSERLGCLRAAKSRRDGSAGGEVRAVRKERGAGGTSCSKGSGARGDLDREGPDGRDGADGRGRHGRAWFPRRADLTTLGLLGSLGDHLWVSP